MSKDAKDAAEAPKKSKMLMIVIAIAVVVLGGAGAGAFVMMSGSTAQAAAEKPEAGAVVTLEPVTINLADGHYLKLGFALQAKLDAAHEPDGALALDLAISQYTHVKVAELSTPKGREHAKSELLKKIKEAYHGDVYDIYFTQFVTQ